MASPSRFAPVIVRSLHIAQPPQDSKESPRGGFPTHQQRIGEIGQVGHQDAHQGAHHDEHRAHAQHHHRPVGYELGVAAAEEERRFFISLLKRDKLRNLSEQVKR